MMDHRRLANNIHQFYEQQSIECVEVDLFEAFLTLLFQEAGQERALNETQMASINRAIASIPTGKQRALRRARDETLQYFTQVCGWVLPEIKVQQFKDHEHLWMVGLYQRSALAHDIVTCYEQKRPYYLKQRGTPDLAWTVLTLMTEVAPLPLNYWCDRLNDPAPMERVGDLLTLTITHPSNLSYFDDKEPTSFTRYALSPLAARAFYNWQQIPKKERVTVTLNRALQALNKIYLPATRTALTPQQWQQAIQALWLHRFAMPAEVLKDFSDPMRHVSELPIESLVSDLKASSALLPSSPNMEDTPNSSPKLKHNEIPFHRWPHVKLIQSYDNPKQLPPNQPTWQADNLLPRLLFDYVQDLINFGGVTKENLSSSTIKRYTNFKNEFSTAPLPIAIAEDKEALQYWAKTIYHHIPDDTMEKWTMYQFFRFLTQQSITEHLDISGFIKPSQSLKIDALCLKAEDVHHLVTQLFLSELSPMQTLFIAVSVLLSYYGALRRGEILRLRLQDIRCTQDKGQSFTLYIGNTSEGNTKSKTARSVSVVIPERGAKLVRLLLAFKACRPSKEVLIGFQDESIHLRARHYLLPITKVLKQYHGKKARFHHLRHSGAKLLYQQALCLANDAAPKTWIPTTSPVTMHLLSKTIVDKRFEYWVQGRDFAGLNNMLLFDELGRMLGHQYYATTRLHYLHGMEWVAPAFLPQTRTYTHADLRYLWGMKPDSNDIARILSTLSPEYPGLSSLEKKRHYPNLEHEMLTQRLSTRLGLPRLDHVGDDTHPYDDKHHPNWLQLWQHKITNLTQVQPDRFQWETRERLARLNSHPETFSILSEAWRAFGQYQGIEWSKTQRTALRPLGDMHIDVSYEHDENKDDPCFQYVHFLTPCNQKIAKALTTLKQSTFHCRCHITLYQNRKRLDSKKWDFIQEALLTGKDTANKMTIPTGSTHLRITVFIKCCDASLLTHFQAWWNAMISNSNY